MAFFRQFKTPRCDRSFARRKQLWADAGGGLLALARSPEKDALKRIEVRVRLSELGEQTFPIALEKAWPELRGQPFLIVGENAASHPFDDCLRRIKLVGVDLQANHLASVAEVVQHGRVVL